MDCVPTIEPRAFRLRLAPIGVLALAAVAGLIFVPPFPQDVEYHNFADQRTLCCIPHALNVLSNIPFVVFGVWGVVWLFTRDGRTPGTCHTDAWEWWAHLLMFACLALTGFGSAYYHANPNNATLYWDRLPLTVVFMTFFVMVVSERISPAAGPRLLVPCVAFGVFGVTWWHWTELQGAGDVRFYALVQFFPLITLPIVLLLFPARYTGTAGLWGVLAWYGIAKLLELWDRPIYTANSMVSGHTLKHLVASLGGLWLIWILQGRRLLQGSPKLEVRSAA